MGGGIVNFERATLPMNDASSVDGNTARWGIAGVYNWGAFTMNDASTVTGNTAGESGGGVASGGTVILNDSSAIHDNISRKDGGGVSLFTLADRTPPSLSMNGSSSIRDNSASGRGGGIHVAGQATLIGVVCGPDGNVHGNGPDDCVLPAH
jgi:predicted outer membrane repeat protein